MGRYPEIPNSTEGEGNCAYDYDQSARDLADGRVEITKCISFQKFRYDKRPGLRNQEKDFMTIKISNFKEKVVRITIFCLEAEDGQKMHPNGLVGKDCKDGAYDKEHVISQDTQEIQIPYLRVERFKKKNNGIKNIQFVLKKRAQLLPTPFNGQYLSQLDNQDFKCYCYTKVCFAVIVSHTICNRTLAFHAVSNVVSDQSEKTTLSIMELNPPSVSASRGGLVHILTTDDGPDIESGTHSVFLKYTDDKLGPWTSETVLVEKDDIHYKRLIKFQVPPFAHCPNITSPVTATLNLQCPQSNQCCSCDLTYSPDIVFACDETNEASNDTAPLDYPDGTRIHEIPKECFNSLFLTEGRPNGTALITEAADVSKITVNHNFIERRPPSSSRILGKRGQRNSPWEDVSESEDNNVDVTSPKKKARRSNERSCSIRTARHSSHFVDNSNEKCLSPNGQEEPTEEDGNSLNTIDVVELSLDIQESQKKAMSNDAHRDFDFHLHNLCR